MKPTSFAVRLAAIGLGILAAIPSSKAEETWTAELPNVRAGVPEALLPPPGVYGQWDDYMAIFDAYDPESRKIPGSGIDLLVEIPTILWVPGIKILGADYAAAVAIPFMYASDTPVQAQHPGRGNLGLFNTAIMPIMLSWSLTNHLFFGASTTFLLPDQTNATMSILNGSMKNGGAPSGNSYSSFMPRMGITWMDDGWTINAGAGLEVPLGPTVSKRTLEWANPYGQVSTLHGYHYRVAPFLIDDVTISKTFGAWTLGVSGCNTPELAKDTLNGHSVPGSIYNTFSVGPVVSYQFKSGLQLTGVWAYDWTKNGLGGNLFDLRFAAPL